MATISVKEVTMALDGNLPIPTIQQLASAIGTQANTLQETLSTLRSQVQRDPSFTGNAAARYDEYIARWDASQRTLVDALHGAGSLLSNFANRLIDDDLQASNGFNM